MGHLHSVLSRIAKVKNSKDLVNPENGGILVISCSSVTFVDDIFGGDVFTLSEKRIYRLNRFFSRFARGMIIKTDWRRCHAPVRCIY